MPTWVAETVNALAAIVLSSTVWEILGIGLASGIAAYFGARGAQRVISRNNALDIARRELHAIASAQLICVSIANSAMAMKRQHVMPLAQKYSCHIKSAESALNNEGSVLKIEMDLQKFPVPLLSTGQLEKLLFENIILSGRAFGALYALMGAKNLMKESIELRNELIEKWKSEKLPPDEIIRRYFGFQDERGRDETYSNLVDSIRCYTDDVIFFSMILAEDIRAIGEKKRENFPDRNAPTLPTMSWANDDQLVPECSEYSAWLKGFPSEAIPPSMT